MGEGETIGNREGGGCQRRDEKNRSGRKAGAMGYTGRDLEGEGSHPFLFALDRGGHVLRAGVCLGNRPQ